MGNPAIKMKVGDTLKCLATYKDADDNPVNLTTSGITVTSKLMSPDGETHIDLDVDLLDQTANPGQFQVTGDTSDLAAGKGWRWDIRYTDSTDYSFSCETQMIDLGERVA